MGELVGGGVVSAIPFTQFIPPHGKRRPTSIEVAPDVHERAMSLIANGLLFECEVLSTGQVSVTITDEEDGDLDIRVIPNGPGVREAVEEMVRQFNPASHPSQITGEQ